MVSTLRMLSKEFWSPTKCFLYYRNKAQDSLKEYLSCREVGINKYFYVLRPLLAIRWLNEA